MSANANRGRFIAGFLALLVIGSGGGAAVSCSNGTASPTPTKDGEPATSHAASALRTTAGAQSVGSLPPDESRSVVQHGPRVQSSRAERSIPFRDLPQSPLPAGEVDHEPLRPPRPGWTGTPLPALPAPTVQSRVPIVSMPVTMRNFAGQGKANGGPCVGGVSCSTPPDPNGAVGPNHFVQTTNVNGNSGLAIWDKSGTLLAGPKHVNTLWTGYVGSAGNACATDNDGDPVVVYDQLADRWFITQFSLPNTTVDTGPSFQCVAVSQTADPTGAYYLYDFSYPSAINDYGKFGIWPDAYYATINQFATAGFLGADFCAYDRNSMVTGAAATQQCFLQPYPTTFPACPAVEPFATFGALPISMDGKIPPPRGEPGLIAQFDYSQCGPAYNQLDIWKFHVDWATPASSTVTGPTVLATTDNFTPTCFTSPKQNCVPQPGTPVTLDGLDDRLMFRFNYRNFGTYESLLINHSVAAGAGSGIRWYELRLAGGAPSIFQHGTYAPADGNWRWMGSIAQDQAQGMALGFAITSASADGGVADPSIAWTGRIATDPLNGMGEGESIIDNGEGVEGNAYPTADGGPGQDRGRWGDYSNMTVDPADDCTLWYTQELYRANAIGGWDTYVASVKFPNCAANDFSITAAPPTQNLTQNGQVTFTVSTTSTAGTAEPVALTVQDLPSGVTGAFVPASVTAGTPSALTLTAVGAALTPATTFTVIGKAPSAVHAATAQVAVVTCGANGQACCVPGNSCATGFSCSNGTCGCGAAGQPCCAGGTCTGAATDACHAIATCTAGTCANAALANGTPCNDGNKCVTGETCTDGKCGGTAVACAAADTCHLAGSCDPDAGACSNPVAPDGTACAVANKCITSPTCTAGTCGGAPLTCTPQDECHDVGTCDPAAGTCSSPNKPDGTPCSIGTCVTGTCTAGAPDSGTPDSGTPDSGSSDAAADADSGGSVPPGTTGGCGCVTVKSQDPSPFTLAGIGGLALVGALRRRRRR